MRYPLSEIFVCVLVLGVAYKKEIDDLRECPHLSRLSSYCRKTECKSATTITIPFIGEGRKYELQMKYADLNNLSLYDCV